MTTFDDLKGSSYVFKNHTLGFTEGNRKHLRYALESGFAYYTRLNQNGPEPFEYLNYAKNDINSNQKQGPINSLGNAKRAIHLTIDTLFEVWGLKKAYARVDFPIKLEVMERLGVFPTRLLKNLNKKRNLIEHEYISIGIDETKEFIEITEMFLMLAHPYLRHVTIGAIIGLEYDDRCIEWEVEIYDCQIAIYEITCSTFIDTPVGQVFYNIPIDEKDRKLLQTVKITRSNQDEWLSQLELFVYLTKRNAHFLLQQDERGDGLHVSRTGLIL